MTAVKKVILLSGSKRSGGFGLATVERLQRSVLAGTVNESPLVDFHIPEGEIIEINGNPTAGYDFVMKVLLYLKKH